MRPTSPLFIVLGMALALGGCAGGDTVQSAMAAPRTQPAAAQPAVAGNNGRFVSNQGENPINHDYYLGADPMFPRGSSSGSYGHPPGGGGP